MENYIGIFMLFFILFIIFRQEKQQHIRRIIKKKKGTGNQMLKLAENFMGKRCIFYTFNNQITGTINEIGTNGILIEEKGEMQIVNPDYVVRIREYPKNKKGKYKDVVFD